MTEFTMGVDLGQSFDPTAIWVVQRVGGRGGDDPVRVGHLERLPLNTPYPGVIGHVQRLFARFPVGTELVLDFTGVGRPVFDMCQAKGLSPIGVTIHGGDTVTHEGAVWSVPKLTLISTVQAQLHNGTLKIQKSLGGAGVLVAELQDFRATATSAGYWRFGAREGKHDDLVLALAIALWRALGANSNTGMLDYWRGLSRSARSAMRMSSVIVAMK